MKYKVGDKVRFTERICERNPQHLTFNKIYVIDYVSSDGFSIYILCDNGSKHWIDADYVDQSHKRNLPDWW